MRNDDVLLLAGQIVGQATRMTAADLRRVANVPGLAWQQQQVLLALLQFREQLDGIMGVVGSRQ